MVPIREGNIVSMNRRSVSGIGSSAYGRHRNT